jgi:large subunit ribosomal protein L23
MSTMKQNKERLYDIIKSPIITEKSRDAIANSQYTFEVAKDATKVEIAAAIELAFPGRKVKKVRTVYMPSHVVRRMRTQSGKKAIVTIEGEAIEQLAGV